jgi:hypothetical protein
MALYVSEPQGFSNVCHRDVGLLTCGPGPIWPQMSAAQHHVTYVREYASVSEYFC